LKYTSVPYNSFINFNEVPGPSRSHTSLQEHHSQDIIGNVSELLPRVSIKDNHIQNIGNTQDAENSAEEDTVPGTPPPPPAKKARYIFRRCFQATFSSQMLPGYDEVLAEDSDDECNIRT
jgi:hypothetical protein